MIERGTPPPTCIPLQSTVQHEPPCPQGSPSGLQYKVCRCRRFWFGPSSSLRRHHCCLPMRYHLGRHKRRSRPTVRTFPFCLAPLSTLFHEGRPGLNCCVGLQNSRMPSSEQSDWSDWRFHKQQQLCRQKRIAPPVRVVLTSLLPSPAPSRKYVCTLKLRFEHPVEICQHSPSSRRRLVFMSTPVKDVFPGPLGDHAVLNEKKLSWRLTREISSASWTAVLSGKVARTSSSTGV